jgi:hypothetical protein
VSRSKLLQVLFKDNKRRFLSLLPPSLALCHYLKLYCSHVLLCIFDMHITLSATTHSLISEEYTPNTIPETRKVIYDGLALAPEIA